MSAASSACDHIYNWINGTPKDSFVSMGVYSDGSYNAPKVCNPKICCYPDLNAVILHSFLMYVRRRLSFQTSFEHSEL